METPVTWNDWINSGQESEMVLIGSMDSGHTRDGANADPIWTSSYCYNLIASDQKICVFDL